MSSKFKMSYVIQGAESVLTKNIKNQLPADATELTALF